MDEDQNQVSDARKEYEEALRIYRGLAEKEPETYLPYVAATLINVGILDLIQNEPEQVEADECCLPPTLVGPGKELQVVTEPMKDL